MKFNAAYFNIKLNDDMYVEAPPGFLVGGKKVDGSVLKLKKTVEGLARATYGRDKTIAHALENLGFSKAGDTQCLYHKGRGNDTVLITVSEEDMFIAAKDPEKIKSVRSKLVAKFHMRDLGSPKKVRGMDVDCHEKHTKIHLGSYIDSLLKDYQMEDCTPRKIPSCGRNLTKGENDQFHDIPAYRSLVAKLYYASMAVRFDIANTVRDLCRFLQKPYQKHWEAALDVVRYLKGTKDQGLTYDSNFDHGAIFCFTGAEKTESRDGEFTCYLATYAGSPVFWKCEFVPIVPGADDFVLHFSPSDENDQREEYFTNTPRPTFGTTNGTVRSHHSAWRAGTSSGIWSVQTMYDVGLPVFFNMYSSHADVVRSLKVSLPYFEPKEKNSAGQYLVEEGLPDGHHLAGFEISTCTTTEEINPVQILTGNLSFADQKKFLRIISPPPSTVDNQNTFRILPDGRIST